jgi:hypothetical protein
MVLSVGRFTVFKDKSQQKSRVFLIFLLVYGRVWISTNNYGAVSRRPKKMRILRTDPAQDFRSGTLVVIQYTCLGVFLISHGFCVQGLCVLLVQEAG